MEHQVAVDILSHGHILGLPFCWKATTSMCAAPISSHCFFVTLQDFDVAPFGLSESEAVMVDPQQRALLEAASSMLAAAAPPAQQRMIQQKDMGVFVGISNPDYSDIKKNATPISVYSATGA